MKTDQPAKFLDVTIVGHGVIRHVFYGDPLREAEKIIRYGYTWEGDGRTRIFPPSRIHDIDLQPCCDS